MIERTAKKLVGLAAILVFQGVAAVDAFGLHGCPQHDALPPVPAEHGVPDDGHGQHGGVPAPHDHGAPASGHHGAEVHAPAGHGAAPGESHHGPCTCVGTCAFGTTAPAAASRDAIRFAPIASALEVTATPYAAEDLPSAPSFLLPFSQGPPLSA